MIPEVWMTKPEFVCFRGNRVGTSLFVVGPERIVNLVQSPDLLNVPAMIAVRRRSLIDTDEVGRDPLHIHRPDSVLFVVVVDIRESASASQCIGSSSIWRAGGNLIEHTVDLNAELALDGFLRCRNHFEDDGHFHVKVADIREETIVMDASRDTRLEDREGLSFGGTLNHKRARSLFCVSLFEGERRTRFGALFDAF